LAEALEQEKDLAGGEALQSKLKKFEVIKLKIAISTDSGKVAEHFGRCPQFTIAEIKNEKVVKKEVIDNPGHSTGFLPKFFQEKGIELLIAGGAGFKAQQLCQQYEIKLILGVSGSVEKALETFVQGNLGAGKNICLPGEGKGYGIKKEDGHEE